MAQAQMTTGGRVTVFAAASLAAAFPAVAAAFAASHPDLRVEFNFAGSSTLARQIEEGAPADVFAAADEDTMRRLVERRAVAGAPEIFARNALQIVVPAGNPRGLAALADLNRPGLLVALCAPGLPCGRYAAGAFARAGVAVPVASEEADVRGVVRRVATGEADAGIAYATDVRAARGRVEGVDVPSPAADQPRYPIAVLAAAADPAAAAVFVAFVRSSEGQASLAPFGFLPP